MTELVKNVMRKIAVRTRNTIENKTGVKITYNSVKNDLDMYLQLYNKESLNNRAFYNICSGGHGGFGGHFYHPMWTNIDVEAPILLDGWKRYNPEKDIWHDLLDQKPLPIESDTAEIIQSQYTIEHIDNVSANYFFKEVYRSLKPGGVFKVVTPNIELDYHAYLNDDKYFYNWVNLHSSPRYHPVYGYKIPLNQASREQVALVHFAANASTIHKGNNPRQIKDEEFKEVMHTMKKEDALDYCTSRCSMEIQRQYRSNHVNWWNHQKLAETLKAAGFKNIKILAPNQSSVPVLRNQKYFDNLYNTVALFMEAEK
ncbi:MAG: class I SAM-dependent methyltransferase [Carboxylicivirga sp.]|jgi:predicted SAM-dependent methyltransferase|nr:class I SAM-dependent methyltransferase [Carboxylicivirga sp.]MCT4643568.1 class I SAM-dependent methyltransferase [Carboxylicivirga sp.]